ncbi:MAG: DUF167 domain-containing protein [Candidatus Omnitrophota bacterium]|jgi:hypothetical protein
MKIFVTARAGAKYNRVEKLDESRYRVFVKEPPEDGKANEAVLKALAEHFGVPSCSAVLLSGARSKNKIIGIQIPTK